VKIFVYAVGGRSCSGFRSCTWNKKINLKLAKEANPIFVKPRPIPLAFKEKVSKQLEELERK